MLVVALWWLVVPIPLRCRWDGLPTLKENLSRPLQNEPGTVFYARHFVWSVWNEYQTRLQWKIKNEIEQEMKTIKKKKKLRRRRLNSSHSYGLERRTQFSFRFHFALCVVCLAKKNFYAAVSFVIHYCSFFFRVFHFSIPHFLRPCLTHTVYMCFIWIFVPNICVLFLSLPARHLPTRS